MKYDKTIPLYNDSIGSVSYVEHMGSDLTMSIQQGSRLAWRNLSLTIGTSLLITLLNTNTLQLSSTILLLLSLWCLCLFVLNTIGIVLGLTMRSQEDIQIKTYSSIYQLSSEHSTIPIDKPQTQTIYKTR